MGNKEVVIVTSGAVGMGRLKISQNSLLSMPLRTHVLGQTANAVLDDSRSAAAAGQSSLMALYELLFAQKAISCAQVLLTDDDFAEYVSLISLARNILCSVFALLTYVCSTERRVNFRNTLNNLVCFALLLHHSSLISLHGSFVWVSCLF